jgi:hypothetical protein
MLSNFFPIHYKGGDQHDLILTLMEGLGINHTQLLEFRLHPALCEDNFHQLLQWRIWTS